MISSATFFKALPWGLAALMTGLAYVMLNLYMDERDAFVAYRAEAQGIAKAQEEIIAAQKKQAEENLNQVRQDYEAKLPVIRRDAVAAYKLRYPNADSCPVPGNGTGQPVDDGAGKECMATEFIADAADTEAKLASFQDYCKRNNCPIKD